MRALREDRLALAAVACLVVLAAVLRFWRIAHQGFWFDEGNTALLAHRSLGDMLALIPRTESTPPLYYVVAWVWARVFGFGEAGLRSLSAVAGVLVVPCAWLAGTRLVSRRAGLIVAALAACNPFLVWYSQEARSYALLVALSAAALAAFAVAESRPERRALTAWAVASALALVTHYYAVVAVAPQAAWLLLRHRRRRDVQIAVGAVLLVGLALIPLAVSQNSTRRDAWIATAPLGLRLRQVVPQLLIGTGAPARTALKYAAIALAAVGLSMLAFGERGPARRGAWREARRGALLAGGLAVGGFVLSLAFVAAGSDTLITRNLIALWLPAAIAVAGGLSLVPGRRTGRVAAAVAVAALGAIGVTAVVGISVQWKLQRPDWRMVAALLGRRPAISHGARERLILIQHYRTLLPLSLYLPGLRFVGHHPAHAVQEIDVIGMSSPQQPFCWWGAACNLIPSGVQARYDIPGFAPVWRRQVRQFTVVRLEAAQPLRVTPQEVAAALTTTSLPRDELLVQR